MPYSSPLNSHDLDIVHMCFDGSVTVLKPDIVQMKNYRTEVMACEFQG